MMLISESDDFPCDTVSSRCLRLVSLRHILRVVIDLPENKVKDFQPISSQTEIPLLRISATCSASPVKCFSEILHTLWTSFSHSRMKRSCSEDVRRGGTGLIVRKKQVLLYCMSFPYHLSLNSLYGVIKERCVGEFLRTTALTLGDSLWWYWVWDSHYFDYYHSNMMS